MAYLIQRCGGSPAWLRRPLRAAAAILCGLCASLFAQSDSAESVDLAESSPFLPPGWSPPSDNAPTAAQPTTEARFVEFRGVYELNGDYFFNVFDKRANKSAWVRLNDRTADFLITAFDQQENSVSIFLNGETARLSLQTPTDRPMPVATAPRPETTSPAERRAETGEQTVTRRRVVRPPVRRVTPDETSSTDGTDTSPVQRRVPVPRRR